jgi:thiol-disulfide isomerase/thioredoxin
LPSPARRRAGKETCRCRCPVGNAQRGGFGDFCSRRLYCVKSRKSFRRATEFSSLAELAIETARPIPGWKPSTPDIGEQSVEALCNQFPAVAIHFWASWNGVDPRMDRSIQQITDRFANQVKFFSADVDSECGTELAQRFGVATVPTLVVLRSGVKPRLVIGLRDAETLADDVESRLSGPEPRPWWAFWRRSF